jgi:hypothetical protein
MSRIHLFGSSWLLGILVLLSPLAGAECTNYENYLHWVDSVEFPGNEPRGVFAQGDYAYAIQNRHPGDFLVYDISLAGNAFQMGSLSLPVTCDGIYASGDLAVLVSEQSDTTATFLTVDISDPADPVLLGSLSTGHKYVNVAMEGDYAYAIGPWSLLDVFDLTDPANPVLIQSLAAPANMYQMEIRDGIVYVVSLTDGLLIFDVSTPGSAYLRSQYWDGESWSFKDLALYGNRVLVSATHWSTYAPQIRGIRVSDLDYPYLQNIWETGFQAGTSFKLTQAGGVAYFGYSTSNLYYLDLENPGTRHSLGRRIGGSLRELKVQDGVLFCLRYLYAEGPNVIYNGWFHMISVASPSPGEPIGAINTPGQSYAVVQDPNAKDPLLYVADGTAGVQIVDVQDPLNPVIVGSVDTPGNAVDIVVDGGLAYVADSGSGLQVVDVSTPASPSIIGSYDTEGISVKLDKVGSIAYVADTDWGLQLLDVSNPAIPFRRSRLDMPLSANAVDVTVGGSLAHVAAEAQGLVICDVSDPDNPWIIDDVKGGTRNITATSVDYSRNRVYVADGADGMTVVDVTDPENISVLGDVGVEGSGEDVQVQGIFTYVCNNAGVNVVDCRDEGSLQIVGNLGVPQTSRGIHLTEFYAYVANGDGIQVCPSQCGFDETAEAFFTPSIENGWLPDVEVTFTNESVGYGLSHQWDFGDGVGTSTEVNPTYTYTEPGDYQVSLTVTNGVNQDTFVRTVGALIDQPTITDVTDIPDDQGGWVYVRFHRSGHDAGQLDKSEAYFVQRRDQGVWVTTASSPAYGDGYYTVEARTLGDGATQYTTEFRVIAAMDEGNWASEVVTGYSEDNIAPAVPSGLLWSNPGVLSWDAATEEDFAYYQVYGAEGPEFTNPVPVGATIETHLNLPVQDHAWFFVCAVDDYGLHSDPTGTQSNTSAVPDAAMATRLFAPVPNPFNPSTTLRFSLAEAGPVQLVVYDISGRRVRVLVDENRGGGSHAVTWNGRDDTGRAAAAGTYFCRMQAEGKVETRRMMLVK